MQVSDFLLEIEKYLTKVDYNLLKKACLFAEKAHSGQKRISQDDYITHPLAVAYNLLKHSFDTHIICAAILHDVIEDTHITKEIIIENFGEDITHLVLGVTKLDKYQFSTAKEANIENFRKFILAFIDDIRILIIKIFDRLENIKTIQYIPKEEKRKRIAKETLDIYAPLAQRLSLHSIKDEMEDLSFEVLEPELRNLIINQTKNLQDETESYLVEAKEAVFKLLKDNSIFNIKIYSRVKKPYSIWKKMQKKKYSFEEVNDILGIRVIVDSTADCYEVLYLIHTHYRAIFARFRDYISAPKNNHYQSLHTCILFNNKKIEIQIRTYDMDSFADKGIASHWNYKSPANKLYDISQYSWLQNLWAIINGSDVDMEDIYEYSKMELFSDEVFVMTPKREVVSLQKGATALDFAYSIHSSIGNTCKEVLIDGISRPIFTTLKNGEKVEIITDKKQEPQTYWLSFVKTGIAKFSIKRYLNQKHRKDVTEQALALLKYNFEKENLSFYQELMPKIMDIANTKSEKTLFDQILEGKIKVSEIIAHLYPHLTVQKEIIHRDIINIKDGEGHDVYFSKCCFPINKDPILGVLLPNNKIEIHHANCEIILTNSNHLNIIEASWHKRNSNFYKAKIRIKVMDKLGILRDITSIITENNIFINKIDTKRDFSSDHYVYLSIVILVQNIKSLNKLIESLSNKCDYIQNIERLIT